VTEAAELVAPNVSERGIDFDYSACTTSADAVRLVRADPDKLRQILVNLLGNAIKFTPPTGRVWMTCAAEGDRMRIAVSDTGRGIPKEHLARIFEPFVQLDRTSTDVRDQGVGLGLAICRELARGMRGELEIESVLGKGSTFSVVLPIAPPTPE
jgi:signal transduction histidine kinase